MSKQSWNDTLTEMVYAEVRAHQRANGADDIIKPLYYAAKPHRRPRKKRVVKGEVK